MDINELYVEQWLQSQGYTNIQFVTDTNDQPPDFIVNGDIAVEVRRLNWMFGDKNKGLESVEKPLERDIKSGLEAAEQPPHGYKVYVSCDLLHTELPDKHMVVGEVGKAASQYVKRLKESIHHGQHLSHSRDETSFRMSIDFITGTSSATNEFRIDGSYGRNRGSRMGRPRFHRQHQPMHQRENRQNQRQTRPLHRMVAHFGRT